MKKKLKKKKNFAVCCDVFLELSCFFSDPADVGNLISGSSAFSKSSLNMWKFTVHVLLKPGLENFEHYFTSMWDEYNGAGSLRILWHCLSLGLEWKLTFSSPVATAKFSRFAGILMHIDVIGLLITIDHNYWQEEESVSNNVQHVWNLMMP